MMEITVAGQTWVFLMAIALGAALGVFYDVFRVIRIAFYNPPGLVLAEDVIFSIVCAAASFLYMLSADSGRIRVFVLIGEAVGFAIYYCTVGTLVIGISRGIITAIKWIFHWVWVLLFAPALRVVNCFLRILSRFQAFLAVYLKRGVKKSNMYLKKNSDLLYNLRKRLHRKRRNTLAERQGTKSNETK